MVEIKQLTTDRLILRKFSKADFADYFEWVSQEEYYTYLPKHSKEKKEAKKSLGKMIKGYKNKKHQNLTWAISIVETGKIVGSVNIGRLSLVHKCCEIGWGLNPKFQKQGFALEAVICLIDFVFNELGMNKISVVVWDGNEPSKKLAKKLGFVQEGIERKARFKNDKFIDLYWYGLLKDEWGRL